MSEDKLNHIEEVLAHHEQQINDLNDVVTRQWDEIDTLKKSMVRMRDKIDVLEDRPGDEELSTAEMAERDKPPHY